LNSAIIICGPTASGKSAFALQLAKRCNGAIINADSCQIFVEIPILTASPSIADKRNVPHYLYNYLPLDAPFSVAQYIHSANLVIEEVQNNGYTPIIVGGTGLYISALINGISDMPNIPSEVRIAVRNDFVKLGKTDFYNRLAQMDQKALSVIKPGDSQRMIRAYEILLQTGRSITEYQNNKSNGLCADAKVIMLYPERKFLYRSCDERFISLIDNGAIEETASVLHRIKISTPKALGLREIASYINGDLSLSAAISLAQAKTRQYAKRQITWFKHQIDRKEILYFASESELAEVVESFLFQATHHC